MKKVNGNIVDGIIPKYNIAKVVYSTSINWMPVPIKTIIYSLGNQTQPYVYNFYN